MAEEQVPLDELVRRPGVVVVSWWSPHSPAAVAFAAEYAHAAASTEGATFTAVNTVQHQDLAQAYGIDEVPVLMVFRDGLLVYRQGGFLAAPVLQQIVHAIQVVDIATLRQAWDGAKEGAPSEEHAPSAPGGPPPAHPAPKH
jgi:thioredoxin-like negative regulator of GroEL